MAEDAEYLEKALWEMDQVLAALSAAEADDLYRKTEALRSEIERRFREVENSTK